MSRIYCFSGSGHSLAVAEFLAGKLGIEITTIGEKMHTQAKEEIAIVVFPVYCQNIPEPVKGFLKTLSANYVALIATYGRISYGNTLYDAKKLVRGEIIAGAYVPIGHTFLNGDCLFDTHALLPVLQRIHAPRKAYIPKTPQNPLANILPAFRSRLGVRITVNQHCVRCGICERNCPVGAIKNGRINAKCIRCLRCVTSCPHNALQYNNRWVLNQYLHAYYRRNAELVLYL